MLHLNALPFAAAANLDGANLDVKIILYNAAKQAIRTYDPSTLLSVTIDTLLPAGTYYMSLIGTGNVNLPAYGSLGSYNLSGTFSPAGALPIREVAFKR